MTKPSPDLIADSSLHDIYTRPGFLIRRSHQILMGIADRECASIGLTPHQHVCLSVLDRCGALDQMSLGKAIGMDRATVGELIRRLEVKGLVTRSPSVEDSRRKMVELTQAGKAYVTPSEAVADRISNGITAALTEKEKKQLIALLTKLTTQMNHQCSIPLEPPPVQAAVSASQDNRSS
ncbi:MAG: MarR family winged helix-turn-helix transcriptional regulator [Pigmentiphaga sp.]|nr:MarR family winged helix-turn-helix transcriptional regulator [Pigmentiphaga sp.]